MAEPLLQANDEMHQRHLHRGTLLEFPDVQFSHDNLSTVTYKTEGVRVTFGKNGYWVIEEATVSSDFVTWRAVADGGIGFDQADSQTYATQHRRGSDKGDRQFLPLPKELKWTDWLYVSRKVGELNKNDVPEGLEGAESSIVTPIYQWKPIFKYEQSVQIRRVGLDFSYKLTALEDGIQIRNLWGYVHFPARETKGWEIKSQKQTKGQIFPEAPTKQTIGIWDTDWLDVVRAEKRMIRAILPQPGTFWLVDERPWGLSTFRLGWNVFVGPKRLTKGDEFKGTFGIRFPRPQISSPLGITDSLKSSSATENENSSQDEKENAEGSSRDVKTVQTNGPTEIVYLGDDWETDGDWRTNYGYEWFILCGMSAPVHTAISGSSGPSGAPPSSKFYVKRSGDVARCWPRGSEPDSRALWNPVSRMHQSSAWDDHGEIYPIGEKQGLWIDLEIPSGPHRLSLRLVEIDWPQYRKFTLRFYERLGQSGDSPEVAKAILTVRVQDFFRGKYVQFYVYGPLALTLELDREDSVNAVISGIFLDHWHAFPYRTIHPVSYGSLGPLPGDPKRFTSALATLTRASAAPMPPIDEEETKGLLGEMVRSSQTIAGKGMFWEAFQLVLLSYLERPFLPQKVEALWEETVSAMAQSLSPDEFVEEAAEWIRLGCRSHDLALAIGTARGLLGANPPITSEKSADYILESAIELCIADWSRDPMFRHYPAFYDRPVDYSRKLAGKYLALKPHENEKGSSFLLTRAAECQAEGALAVALELYSAVFANNVSQVDSSSLHKYLICLEALREFKKATKDLSLWLMHMDKDRNESDLQLQLADLLVKSNEALRAVEIWLKIAREMPSNEKSLLLLKKAIKILSRTPDSPLLSNAIEEFKRKFPDEDLEKLKIRHVKKVNVPDPEPAIVPE